MLPLAIRPFSSNIPVKVFVKTDFPEPDSPTKASTSPSTKSMETPRIAVKTLSRTSNSTTISRAVKITLFSFVMSTPIYVYVDHLHPLSSDQQRKGTMILKSRSSMESRTSKHWLLRFESNLKSNVPNLVL